jgi:hypothetical protein
MVIGLSTRSPFQISINKTGNHAEALLQDLTLKLIFYRPLLIMNISSPNNVDNVIQYIHLENNVLSPILKKSVV